MPAVVIPAGFLQMTLTMQLASSTQTAEVVFGIDSADEVDFNLVNATWRDSMMDIISSQYTFTESIGRVATGAIWSDTFSTPGGDANGMPPAQVSLLVRKSTLLPGRTNKGRMYLPGPRVDKITSQGNLDSTYKTTVQTKLDEFYAALIADAGPHMVILHSSNADPTPVQGLIVQPMVATQRRRLR